MLCLSHAGIIYQATDCSVLFYMVPIQYLGFDACGPNQDFLQMKFVVFPSFAATINSQ